MQTILVTGGAGFIGSCVVRSLIRTTNARVINVDKLSYAGNLDSLAGVLNHDRHVFEQVDIRDAVNLRRIFAQYQPDAVLHLAAESHVDRSIDAPAEFIQTNVVGTMTLLEAALRHYEQSDGHFRFIHVSTDEVFGSLGESGSFDTDTPYDPSSPYSASKAASDHLVRAWHRTYGLPVIISNCSNNFGPYQFPEKLIPLIIIRALRGERLPVYGAGENVRDWLYVEDHVKALLLLLDRGSIGDTYLIGGHGEQRNIDVVRTICDLLDVMRPRTGKYADLIEFVQDRPGHDFRYAINPSKISNLGWRPSHNFHNALRQTVRWYMENQSWWARVLSGEYRSERLGIRDRLPVPALG